MSQKRISLKKLISFFYELGSLRQITRAHKQQLLVSDLADNIASHSFRAALIAWFLAEMEKADKYKTVVMCLMHDLEEARTGDINWINKRYVKVFEEEVEKDQVTSLPGEKELLALNKEYRERRTKEAKLAKDAELLEQALLVTEYKWRGNRTAKKWLNKKNVEKVKKNLYSSQTAHKLRQEIVKQDPSKWWENLQTWKRR